MINFFPVNTSLFLYISSQMNFMPTDWKEIIFNLWYEKVNILQQCFRVSD